MSHEKHQDSGKNPDLSPRIEPLNPLGIDTILFDYGGVVGTHRVEPYWGILSAILEADPKVANKYMLETSPHGIAFRLGDITMEQFWEEAQRLAGVSGKDARALMDNWARSYAMDPKMIELSERLRARGYKTGILMNSDAERYKYIQETYHIEQHYDFIISSNIHRVTKPDPQAYEVAKQVVGRSENSSAVLYIDDRKSNADVAVQQGMQGYTFLSYEKTVDWFIDQGILEEEPAPWKEEIYGRERRHIAEFFGRELPIAHIPTEITKERLDSWHEQGMGLHYLPNIDFDRQHEFPGWKVKPYEWFYERAALGDVLDFDDKDRLVQVEQPTNLGGRWVLIDERPKPTDNNGQVYPDDFLEETMRKMRTEGSLDHNQELNPGTRFFTSWTEWYEKIRLEAAKLLGVRPEQTRLPRVVEYNYFGNLLHPDWGTTDTWEWLQEACGGGKYRMRGGHSFAGGLAIVYWRGPAGHGTDRGFRPVVDFSK